MNFWKRYVFTAVAVLSVTLSAATLACATPSIYNVNRIIGAGSVTGFIETDGLSGVLTAADFVDWNLVLFDGTSTFDLFGPLSGNNSSVFIQGADAEAFGPYLLFNFSGIDNGIFLFQQGLFSDNHYYCDSSQPGPCFPGETVVPISVSVGYQNNPDLRGVVVIGDEAAIAPEPGTLVLALTGIGMAVRNRRLRSFFIDGAPSWKR
jgi:hypothetical protein